MRAILAQTAMELRLALRRGESLLVTIVLPAGLLLVFGATDIFGVSGERPVDYLMPGILTLAVMAAGLVSLSIATAFERHYGVLKRLGGSPLTRGQLIAAKATALIVTTTVQVLLLASVAGLVFRWRPAGSAVLAPLIVLLGLIAFSSVGLAMAGVLRAEATLALANGLFLLLLLSGGLFLPLAHLPAPLEVIAKVLPAYALADLLRATFNGQALPLASLLVLAAWAVVGVTVTLRSFRWE